MWDRVSPGSVRRSSQSSPRKLQFARPGRVEDPSPRATYTGIAVFLSGLKNGIFTTFAVAFCRMASIVISICSLVPSLRVRGFHAGQRNHLLQHRGPSGRSRFADLLVAGIDGNCHARGLAGSAGVSPNFS